MGFTVLYMSYSELIEVILDSTVTVIIQHNFIQLHKQLTNISVNFRDSHRFHKFKDPKMRSIKNKNAKIFNYEKQYHPNRLLSPSKGTYT